jgi:CARDB
MTVEYVHLKYVQFLKTLPPGASLADLIPVGPYFTSFPQFISVNGTSPTNGIAGYYWLAADYWTETPQDLSLIQRITAPGGFSATMPVWAAFTVPGTVPFPIDDVASERTSITTPITSAGSQINLSFQVDNNGPAPVATNVGIYLSSDPTININDRSISSFAIYIQPHHSTFFQNIPVTLPANINPGRYYAGILIDFDGSVSDANPNNNASAVPVTILHSPTGPNPISPIPTTADLILRQSSTGRYEIYDIGNNSILAAYALGQVGLDWQFVGLGGFFGTDTADMLLRSSTTGGFEVYDISYNNITGAAFLGSVGLDWQVMGFGNFSSRGETDMILRNVNTGGVEVYDIRNNQITGAASMGAVGLNWKFSGVGNFSSRGESDMLLRNSDTGGLEVYDITNNQITGAAFIGTIGLNWQFSGVGNFSGVPGEADLLLRNADTGGLEVYDINHNQLTGAAFIGTVGLDWQFAGIAPIHAPGASDLVLRNVNTGQFEVYDIANNQLTGAASLGFVGLDWQLGGFAADLSNAFLLGSSRSQLGSTDSTSQLLQAMAGFDGGSGAADGLNVAPLSVDTSQQSLLMTPHG